MAQPECALHACCYSFQPCCLRDSHAASTGLPPEQDTSPSSCLPLQEVARLYTPHTFSYACVPRPLLLFSQV